MGAAENSHMDLFLFQLPVHIFVIHPPYAIVILLQRTVHDLIAIAFQAPGKTDIGRTVYQHPVSRRRKRSQGRNHTSQHAVFITDIILFQILHIIPGLLPFHDRLKIFFTGIKISKQCMISSFNHFLRHCRHRRKIHIRNPHRDYIKALFRLVRRKARILSNSVNRQGIFSLTVDDRCKIIFHFR